MGEIFSKFNTQNEHGGLKNLKKSINKGECNASSVVNS